MLKKAQKNNEFIWVGVFVLLYLITRLYNFLILPLFTDESIYIYWAKVIAETHSQWFISLTDGKPPILIWMISLLLTIFPHEWYLLAGRLPSVFAGLLGLLGIYCLTKELFPEKRTALIAALLYIICPMTLFYDRMALFDSLLTAMLVWSVYFAVQTGRTRSLRDAVGWGLALGFAFLAKPTALVFLPLTVFAAGVSIPWKDVRKHWKKLALLSFLALILGEGLNNLQRISSAYPAMVQKNAQFQQPISELLSHPFALTWGNLQGFFSWSIGYLTVSFFLFIVIAFLYGLYQRSRPIFLLLILWLAPLVVLATVGREVFPRYILIVFPYLLIAAAYLTSAIVAHKTLWRKALLGLLLLIIVPVLSFDYFILTDPTRAPLPQTDANQYILDHPSGYGLEAVYTFLRERSATEKITVVTQGTFGLYPYAFYLEFWGNPNVTILPKWPLDTIDQEIHAAAEKGPVYIILKEHDAIPTQLPLKIVLKAEKPGGKYPILVTTLQE